MKRCIADVLNEPRVVAWILKGLVKECQNLSIEDIMEVYLPKTHRYVRFGYPKPSWSRKCWYYDIDVPLNLNAEDLNDTEAKMYDKARSDLLYLNADFYAICAEDIRRGYRVNIEFSEELDTSYVEDEIWGSDLPGMDFAHFVIIHVGKSGSGYLQMLSEVYQALSSLDTLEQKYKIRI